jgi:hypothetical protein
MNNEIMHRFWDSVPLGVQEITEKKVLRFKKNVFYLNEVPEYFTTPGENVHMLSFIPRTHIFAILTFLG